MEQIKILISNKYFLMNYAIRCILQRIKEFDVTGVEEEDVLAEIKKQNPDILITEVEILKEDGFNLLAKIREKHPKLKILALLELDDRKRLMKMLELKLAGYILKNTNREELIGAVHTVYRDEKYYSAEINRCIVEDILNNVKDSSASRTDDNKISDREKEILNLIVTGYNNKIIADRLFISENTVATHRRNIMKKMHVKNTPQLIVRSLKQGLVTLSE